MKNASRVLTLLIFVALALLSGCAKHYRSTSGHWITWPRDSTATAIACTLATNAARLPFFIEVQHVEIDGKEGVRQQVNPGQSYIYHGKTYEMLWVKIIWFCSDCQEGLGHSKEELDFDYTFLYRGKPLIVDDLFLHGLELQEGYVQNNTAHDIKVWDNQNNVYLAAAADSAHRTTLITAEFSLPAKVVPGLVTFYWKIVDKDYLARNPRERDVVHSDVRWIDGRRNAHGPNGILTGWTFEINPPGTEAKKQHAIREAANHLRR